ncbi:MAG TPA: fibronectin type III domain-containing protein [Verrucomicrobiae bacterium]|jgi:hypothetical protein|nr:fibronectin type III domain-containing protein [Verrucomicrobiae bacterium]
MNRKTFLFSLGLVLAAAAPLAYADTAVVSDAQVIDLGQNNFLLKLRSSGPQAFDATLKNPTTLEVRLYQATLGTFAVPSTPFGGVTFTQDKAEQVLMRLTLNDPTHKPRVQQGDSADSVDIYVRWMTDNKAPVLSAVNVTNITQTGADITWTTDEAADSSAAYGLSQPPAQTTTVNTTPFTAHKVTLTGLAPGKLYYYSARSADIAGNLAASNVLSFTTKAPAFAESGGQVVIEAEHYDVKTPRAGKDWVLESAQSGASGSRYATALPNSGANLSSYVNQSPELVYNVLFTATGTYYVWIRGAGPTTADDSVHAGIDGTGPASASNMDGFPAAWTWKNKTTSGAAATLVVHSPGLHTIHLWMREDGFRADKILLRQNSSATAPSGTGPAESPRQ